MIKKFALKFETAEVGCVSSLEERNKRKPPNSPFLASEDTSATMAFKQCYQTAFANIVAFFESYRKLPKGHIEEEDLDILRTNFALSGKINSFLTKCV